MTSPPVSIIYQIACFANTKEKVVFSAEVCYNIKINNKGIFNMKNTKWVTGKYDENIVSELMNTLGIPSLTAKLLAVRGICDAESASMFLKKDLCDLHNPFLLKDMDRAVERIKRALDCGEKIAVYGDYDADGVTSTYILVDYLKN